MLYCYLYSNVIDVEEIVVIQSFTRFFFST